MTSGKHREELQLQSRAHVRPRDQQRSNFEKRVVFSEMIIILSRSTMVRQRKRNSNNRFPTTGTIVHRTWTQANSFVSDINKLKRIVISSEKKISEKWTNQDMAMALAPSSLSCQDGSKFIHADLQRSFPKSNIRSRSGHVTYQSTRLKEKGRLPSPLALSYHELLEQNHWWLQMASDDLVILISLAPELPQRG